ncbi:MAG: nuclear transport factor 2 family protein [Salinisphaeraceae bacterium]
MAISDDVIATYQAFFENLTDASVEDFRNLAVDDVRYRDPLMDSQGIDAVVSSMYKWFHDMDGIQFRMMQHAQTDLVLFQHWVMTFRIRKLPRRLWELEGVSRVTFDTAGKVVDQIDYWDTAPMFESVPVLGRAVWLIKRLFT